MTAGAMIAAGIGFTLPGLWNTGKEVTMSAYFLVFLSVSLVGLLMGLLLTWFWRNMLLTKENLPFPIGVATAETIETSEKGSIKTVLLSISLFFSVIFTVARDWLLKIPAILNFKFLNKYHGTDFQLSLSPMLPAIGYIIGPLYTLVLFIGGILAYFLLIPIGMDYGIFSGIEEAHGVRQAIRTRAYGRCRTRSNYKIHN